MTANISISEATEPDLPAMVAITVAATELDILTRFHWGHRRAEAAQKQTDSLLGSLGSRFTHPTNRCHILKAVDGSSGEIVGWSLVRWEDGSWVTKPLAPPPASGDKPDFATHYQREYRKNWVKISEGGKPHVLLGALHVRPDVQGRGIGRALVEYCYATYGLAGELVALQTSALSEGFYARLGWVTVDSTEIDLSEFAGPGRGYGVHRSPQMVRYPETSPS